MSDVYDHAYERLAVEDDDSLATSPNRTVKASKEVPAPPKTPTDSPLLSTIHLRTDEGESAESEFPDFIRLVEIGKPRRTLNVDFSWTLTQFKQRFFADEIQRGASIRLIYQGRLLQDDNSLLSSHKICPNGFVHVVISKTGGPQSAPGFHQPDSQSGCAHDDFDNGLMNDEELARHLQHRDRDDNEGNFFVPVRGARGADENQQRNNPSEFACGFVTGLLLGIWAFLFLLSPRWRQSRRFRSGVILGLLVNVVISVSQRPNN